MRPPRSSRRSNCCKSCIVLTIMLFAISRVMQQYYTFSPYDLPITTVATPEELCADTYDAVLVLGGGRPISKKMPPPWVQARADAAGRVFECKYPKPMVLTLSAGTAHVPPLLLDNGFPVFESGATAWYLKEHAAITAGQIVMETTSYDTIGNAYFARTSHTEVRRWTKLLVITSKYHMERTKAIFQWVFSLPITGSSRKKNMLRGHQYDLSFYATPDKGLTQEEIEARLVREKESLESVLKLKSEIATLEDMHAWMTRRHELYSVGSLKKRSQEIIDPVLLKSYGGFPDDP